METMINQFKIPKYKVHTIVHDSASNMLKGIENSHYNSLPCFTHTTQLALNDCIFDQISVKNIVNKCKNIYSHFNNSYLAMSRLHEIQRGFGHKELVPLNNCPTRWDSTYLMLVRILQLKMVIIAYSSTYDCVKMQPSEWTMIETLSELFDYSTP